MRDTQLNLPPAIARPVSTILVVDDNLPQMRLLSVVLSRWGYDVLTARSGDDALDVLGRTPVDLVLSDWVMPGMSGIELCQRCRSDAAGLHTYFILLTSRDAQKDIAEGLAAGADDILRKPFDGDELRARIAAGERLMQIQRELARKNRLLQDTVRELQTVHDRIARDLTEARRLQRSLLPETFVQFDGASAAMLLQPSGQVGGDLVGAFRVSETRVGLFAFDVSGHGIAAALLAARLAGHLTGSNPEQNLALTIDEMGLYHMRPVDEICAEFNRVLLEDLETDLYCTMLIAECNLRTGKVQFTQAGHPPPLVQRVDGQIETVGFGGPPVGLFAEARFQMDEITLGPGDRFLLYSDGITECALGDGGLLGGSGLSSLLQSMRGTPAEDVLDTLHWEISNRTKALDVSDDISALLLEFQGQP